MIVWDLDARDVPVGEVTEWAGDGLTLTAESVTPTCDGTAIVFPARVPGPPFRLATDALAAIADGDAVHVVAEISGIASSNGANVEWGYVDLWWGVSGVGISGSLHPVSGLAVVTAVQDGDSVTLLINGVEVGTSSWSTVGATSLRITNNVSGASWRVRRLVGSRGDAASVAAALTMEYLSSTVPISAASAVEVEGRVAVSTDDNWLPPVPPVLAPGGAVEPPEDPEPQDPPATVKASRIRRVSEVMPAAPLVDGRPEGWKPTTVVSEVVGRLQVVVEGVDITYWDGVETPHPVWSRVEPFGADQATIELPQITAFSQPGTGDLAWCRAGANVTIRLVTSSETIDLWRGVVTEAGVREDTGVYTLACLGLLFTGDLQLRTPPFSTTPIDVGRAVARALNGVLSRRYQSTAPVVTGCKTSVQGGWEPTLTGWVTQMLATAVRDGRQWTVTCESRQPVIELKDTGTVHWTVRAGQRGIAVDLKRDITQAPNRIFAEGIRPDGGRWRNAMYPNWRDDDTPDYDGPLGQGMTVGWSSPGVRLWQEKAGRPVTGTLSQGDRVEWRRIQAEAGIQVDDYLGPQTWAASFGTGSNTGSLDGAFIAPIASAVEVRPDLLGPDGDVLGPNPNYVRDVLPVDRYINYGAGVTKDEGRRAARELLARDADPGWVGTVTFTMDPNEGSRYMIREGHNIRIQGVQGSNVLVHVARVEVSESTVTCTVDSKARDYPTLDAILDRERAAVDPARAYRRQQTKGTVSTDRATWDSESPGGKIPKHALFGGLWNVLRIPFAQYGEIVRSTLTTSGPAAPFSVAVFDRPVTAAQLVATVGNPLTAEENPWQEKADDLDDLGLLMAWGWKEQPCGFYPRDYQTPDGEKTAPVTGRFVDDAAWRFVSTQSPWLWVAVIASVSCRLEGRFLAGVID